MKRLLTQLGAQQPLLAALLGVSQAHVSRLANAAPESPQTSRLLDILERDIAAGVDVAADGYRIGFPADAPAPPGASCPPAGAEARP